MGQETNDKHNHFMNIVGTSIAEKVESGTPNSIKRVNKEGNTVYELNYTAIWGILTNIEFKEGRYGKEIIFILKDGLDTTRLQLLFSTKVAKDIICRLPNADFTKDIKIHVKRDEEKKKAYCFITQINNETKKYELVVSAHNKKEPNGMPPMMKYVCDDRTEKWNDVEQIDFLEKMIKTTILPKLQDYKPEESTDFITDAEEVESGSNYRSPADFSQEPADALPF